MRVKRIALGLLAVGGLLVIVWLARVAVLAQALNSHLAQAQSIVETKKVDPRQACALVQSLRNDVTTLNQEVGVLVSLAPLFGWLPSIGGDLQDAPQLFATADGLSEAGFIICESLAPALSQFDKSNGAAKNFSIEQITNLLAAHPTDLQRAANATERAQTAWTQVDSRRLSPTMTRKTSILDRAMPLARAGLGILAAAPDLLGANSACTYLILALNEDELRPGGGFISGAGRLTIEQGKIVDLSFIDGNLVDDLEHNDYPDPPAPLLTYMASEVWLFRDANWSPDFPTSARQAAWFYELGQHTHVDGVIAVDQGAIELLLAGLGNIQVDGLNESVNAGNIRQLMHEAWNPSDAGITYQWIFSRKEFMGRLATAIRHQIETAPGQIDLIQTALGIYNAFTERHLLVFSNDSRAAHALSQLGWDGALQSTNSDYLMVVDANVGFSKVNPLIQENLMYHVTLRNDGTAQANLFIDYSHQGRQPNVTCQQAFPYVGNLTYDLMMQRCYYDYLRVLIPSNSHLISATALPTPARYLMSNRADDGKVSASSEMSKTVLSQFFVVEYGKTIQTQFNYDLPLVAQLVQKQRVYSVVFQKQPGTYTRSLDVTVTLPSNAHLVSTWPTATAITGNQLDFTFQFDADLVVRVIYE